VAGVLVNGFNVAPNNQLGDGVDANDMPFLPYFPYVAPPQNPFDHEHHLEQRAPHSTALGAASPGLERGTLALAGRNPASMSVLQYTLSGRAHVGLRIYDLQGRVVRTLLDQDAAAGTFRATWDGRDDTGAAAGSGVFFARLTSDGSVVDTRKIVVAP